MYASRRAGCGLRNGFGKRRDLALELARLGELSLYHGSKDRQVVGLWRGLILSIAVRRKNMKPDPRLAGRRFQSATNDVGKRLCEIRGQVHMWLNNKRHVYDGHAA